MLCRAAPLIALGLLVPFFAHAEPRWVRYTGAQDSNAELTHVLGVIQQQTGYELKASDFLTFEDRELATSRFKTYLQTAGGIPLQGLSIRTWVGEDGRALQVEALVEDPAASRRLLSRARQLGLAIDKLDNALTEEQTLQLVREQLARHSDDRVLGSVRWRDEWRSGQLVRSVEVKGRRGKHRLVISFARGKVIESRYEMFPQADPGEISLPALVYPIYEQADGTSPVLPRIAAQLKHLKTRVTRTTDDLYAPLRAQRYFESRYHPILGETEEGRKQGYWSPAWLKREAARLRAAAPLAGNDFEDAGPNGGMILEGRYASVSLHPAVTDRFPGLGFAPQPSTQYKPDWRVAEFEGREQFELVPGGSVLGQPLRSPTDALTRPARRLPDHDPATYINDGFDEVQVYYAIDRLFESLHAMGFADPELSTRPFSAFMYDPDISMRDNAYYTDDTINFTTYSPDALNFARDNSTIWHELGHGIMDRLMGDLIRLADTGGLSEGMADFVAQLVVEDVMEGQDFPGSEDFRIRNKTGFLLTNEVHDDGEAYGGSMHDILEAAIATFGREAGLAKMGDLTMETMRLTRNHPALTAQEWFGHMLFADERGQGAVRAPGEMSPLILGALAGRNFNLDGAAPAKFTLSLQDGHEITGDAPGTRESPIRVQMKADEEREFLINVKLDSSKTYGFKYPVTVKVQLEKGPLQGAIHWAGEEQKVLTYTLADESQTLTLPLRVSGTCEFANRDDGSCVDFAWVQIWDEGETGKPQAKKRFYLRIKTQ